MAKKVDQTDPFGTGAGTQFLGDPGDWREYKPEDQGDEDMEETPEDVIEMIGFDPLELEDDD